MVNTRYFKHRNHYQQIGALNTNSVNVHAKLDCRFGVFHLLLTMSAVQSIIKICDSNHLPAEKKKEKM